MKVLSGELKETMYEWPVEGYKGPLCLRKETLYSTDQVAYIDGMCYARSNMLGRCVRAMGLGLPVLLSKWQMADAISSSAIVLMHEYCFWQLMSSSGENAVFVLTCVSDPFVSMTFVYTVVCVHVDRFVFRLYWSPSCGECQSHGEGRVLASLFSSYQHLSDV
jgi:hypothetical protein